ncbi:hypothetical protein MMC18_008002 [Xylographa bjoerkii]|nr:hypothetical protein [Xylographa bjoerkii]
MSKGVEKRPLIFVAHSLGGIVVKDAVNTARAERSHLSPIFPATFGICFLGTPHRGSSKAALAETLSRITQVWGNTPNLQILQALQDDAETLDRIQTTFKRNRLDHEIKIRTFHEGLDYKGIKIVDRFSSTMDLPDEIPTDIPANHVDMTKFNSSTDVDYLRVSNALIRWLTEIEQLEYHAYDLLVSLKEDCLRSLEDNSRHLRLHQVEVAHNSTYSWLFEDSIGFSRWLKRPPHDGDSIFWIKGKPGSGKSTLMKFATQNLETQKLLECSNQMSWSVISFFFHDRGTEVQKTLESLLKEILYQIIKLYPNLIPLVLHLYLNQSTGGLPGSHALKRCTFTENGIWNRETAAKAQQILEAAETAGTKGNGTWPVEDVKMALDIVVLQKKVPINVCLFVDALDEHKGDPRVLLGLLNRLAKQESAGNVYIKLCLASRPEPVFTAGLHSCPELAIHDHTAGDIAIYATDCIKSSLHIYQDTCNLDLLKQLVEEIMHNSNGVFIWVKLVVNELVEGIEDGSNIIQLRKLIDTIPVELNDLYRRIITNRKPAYMLEASIMLQAVLYTRRSLSPEALIAITDVALCPLRHPPHPPHPVSMEVMQQRIMSRCGGLLDIYQSDNGSDNDSGTDSSDPKPSVASESEDSQAESNAFAKLEVEEPRALDTSGEPSDPTESTTRLEPKEYRVQLLHQTFKEFLLSQTESDSIFPPSIPVSESVGCLYMLQFCVYIATEAGGEEVLRFKDLLQDLFFYARQIGWSNENCEIAISEVNKLLPRSSFDSTVFGVAPRTYDGLWIYEYFFTTKYERIDIEPIPDHGQYDLLVTAAEQGFFFYVRNQLLEGLPIEQPGRCPLIISVMDGIHHYIEDFRPGKRVQEAEKLCIDLLEIILAKGANLECTWNSVDPVSALFQIPLYLHIHYICLEWLLIKGSIIKDTIDINNFLRHFSISAYSSAKLLLQNGANAMRLDGFGWYPLFYSIRNGVPNMAELLCQRGADPTRLGNGLNGLEPDTTLLERLDLDLLSTDRSRQIFCQQAVRMHDMLKRYEKHPDTPEMSVDCIVERNTESSGAKIRSWKRLLRSYDVEL